ncbi:MULTISPECIES: hypothetical protein [Neisseria]|uniref:hypothetical protein n=1 Tax=Neisseria TaxID=482 RepID=UPI001071601F|nr:MULTISPECIES: hypothetical protein [Neisseria]MBF0803598.1 hypothetical protein [Neisseria sp. 19428wB4_WF04]TFU43682.1 hypothetical protein E4T99_04410 [Neisseria sp. WF04]
MRTRFCCRAADKTALFEPKRSSAVTAIKWIPAELSYILKALSRITQRRPSESLQTFSDGLQSVDYSNY